MNLIEKIHAVNFNVNLSRSEQSLSDTVGSLFSLIGLIAGILVFGYLIYSGFIYITAGGNTEQAKKGVGGITNAIIGLLIIVLAYSLFYGIKKAVTGATVN